jgi:hypothetical protein
MIKYKKGYKYQIHEEYTIKVNPISYTKDGQIKTDDTVILKSANGSHLTFIDNYLTSETKLIVLRDMLCEGLCFTKKDNIKVNFSHLYGANKVPPKLYYTNQYNGNARTHHFYHLKTYRIKTWLNSPSLIQINMNKPTPN